MDTKVTKPFKEYKDQTLVERLRNRAIIRRNAKGRKSVEEGKADRLADLLDEAAIMCEMYALEGHGKMVLHEHHTAELAKYKEAMRDALAYIKHVGANHTMRGEPHPQQWIVDKLEALLK